MNRAIVSPAASAAVLRGRRVLRGLFGSWSATIITLVVGYLIVRVLAVVADWALVEAVWSVPGPPDGRPDLSLCERAQGAGACWPAVSMRYRFLAFGNYPAESLWRPATVLLTLPAVFAYSAWLRLRGAHLPILWLAYLALAIGLMRGGLLGLVPVPPDLWGGLTLTLLIAILAILGALPIGILLALGRVNLGNAALRVTSTVYIEVVRGLPLISLLFMGNFLLPLFFPPWLVPSALTRAIIAITLFAAAYVAEVVRAGVRPIPRGQSEAAASLGLPRWVCTWRIIVPQALLLVLAPLLNTFVAVLKDTSLVIVIGLLDLFAAAQSSAADPQGQHYFVELYAATAVVYFGLNFAMSWVGARLERAQPTRR